MAAPEFTPSELAAANLIPQFNIGTYNAQDNPYGFGLTGHVYNLMPSLMAGRTMGLAAKRMAELARADAIQTALDRVRTGLDVISTQDLLDAAQDEAEAAAASAALSALWAGAPEGTAVTTGKYSALHWAAKAAAFAAGLNLPPINTGEGGRYLQAKSDRSGFTLTALPFATQGEIDAGTGVGIVRSDRLGVRLAAIQSAISVAGEVIPPIGSMLLMPKFATPPSEAKWLPADGRLLSKAAYPEIAAILPVVPFGYRGDQPLTTLSDVLLNNSNTGSAANSSVYTIGQNKQTGRVAIIQAAFLRVYSPGAINPSASIGASFGDVTSPKSTDLRCVAIPMANNTLVATTGGLVYAAHANGGRSNIFNFVATGGAFTFLHQLPNGTILAFLETTSSALRCYRLNAGLNETVASNWVIMNPGGSEINSNNQISWTDKAGYLYILCHGTGEAQSAPYRIYRTLDGASWSLVANGLTLDNTPTTGYPGCPNTQQSMRYIDEGRYESADGQRIVVRNGYREFLYSTNAGASWARITAGSIVGTLTYDSTSSLITCCYDPWKDDFIFATIHVISAANRLTAVRTSNFAAFTPICSALPLSSVVNLTHNLTSIVPLKNDGFILFYAYNGNSLGYRAIVNYAGTLSINDSTTPSGAIPRYKLLNYIENDHVILTNNQFAFFIDKEGTPDQTIIKHNAQTPIYQMLITDNKQVFSDHDSVLRIGNLYNYNPDVEVKLPNIVHEYSTAIPGGYTYYQDVSRNGVVGFKHLIRVK